MPKRKITLEEAFAAIEQHGLRAKIVSIADEGEPSAALSEFLQPSALSQQPAVVPSTKGFVKITLYAPHTVASGGRLVKNTEGDRVVVDNNIETYGPGVVVVPLVLAQQLLHQDALAREADDKMLDRKFRSYLIVAKGTANVKVAVGEHNNASLDDILRQLGNGVTHLL